MIEKFCVKKFKMYLKKNVPFCLYSRLYLVMEWKLYLIMDDSHVCTLLWNDICTWLWIITIVLDYGIVLVFYYEFFFFFRIIKRCFFNYHSYFTNRVCTWSLVLQWLIWGTKWKNYWSVVIAFLFDNMDERMLFFGSNRVWTLVLNYGW